MLTLLKEYKLLIKELNSYLYGINLNSENIKILQDYCKFIILYKDKHSIGEIASLLNISVSKIKHWVYDGNKPTLVHLMDNYLALGKPKRGFVWISINATRGGLFIGPWIQVPKKINSPSDLFFLTSQMRGFSKINVNKYKNIENLFAYLLGFIVGDSSKTGIKRKYRTNRRIHVRLSKRFQTNEQLGEFVSSCSNSLGLSMQRRKDCPKGKKNTHPFYTWISQSSSFFQWIFDVCLGLKDTENTTYNSIKANWILNMHRDFKIAFIQGLADSDGFVDFGYQKIGVITEPNTHLVNRIFLSLGIKTKERLFTNNKLWSLMINLKEAYNLALLHLRVF